MRQHRPPRANRPGKGRGTSARMAALAGSLALLGGVTAARTDRALSALEQARDHLAEVIKGELSAAAFQNRPVPTAGLQTLACQAIITGAEHLSASS